MLFRDFSSVASRETITVAIAPARAPARMGIMAEMTLRKEITDISCCWDAVDEVERIRFSKRRACSNGARRWASLFDCNE
ncbi:hypothetical protein predicted by Glimmer/Critica [Sorangium cellulosum So ce56]|uniref:Uncharacterized protein n=1 Tax=Sorangium cellulosum (strain So ce56) TaxID=448385 RepID=A9FYX3_SORC5|nr:hypothetical protein predicted by Glimmer/Critica [Sorangium cellulosum So ce56]